MTDKILRHVVFFSLTMSPRPRKSGSVAGNFAVVPSFHGSLIGDKTWSAVFDNTKIKTFVPGYQAVIPFHEGIRRTFEWYDADESRKWVDEPVNADIEKILAAYAGR
jgi:hypothetical protein